MALRHVKIPELIWSQYQGWLRDRNPERAKRRGHPDVTRVPFTERNLSAIADVVESRLKR